MDARLPLRGVGEQNLPRQGLDEDVAEDECADCVEHLAAAGARHVEAPELVDDLPGERVSPAEDEHLLADRIPHGALVEDGQRPRSRWKQLDPAI